MYLKRATIVNSGPIADLEFVASLHPNGTPKPIIFVGGNGSGKTEFLSIVADALIEIAANHFQDISRKRGIERSFYRVLGSRNQRTDTAYSLSVLRFEENEAAIFFKTKTGYLAPGAVKARMADYGPVSEWSEKGNEKMATGDEAQVRDIYRTGTYLFFPTSRHEAPHWSVPEESVGDSEVGFGLAITAMLDKPIVVETALNSLKPWIVDAMLDQSVDVATVVTADDLKTLISSLDHQLKLHGTLHGLNSILRLILHREDSRIVRTHRGFRERRLAIALGNSIGLPTLDHLSAGQSTLLSMFGTIVRYGQSADVARPINEICGIVIIDEVDAHMHSELQHDVLPRLIAMFPRIQFIVSSHAPLFLLGMRNLFGAEGMQVIDMPSGETIDVEGFSEFEVALGFFKATRAFEESVRERLTKSGKPMVLMEGETDPVYLRAAAELLQRHELLERVDFEWVGTKAAEGARGGGKTNLAQAARFLRNNSRFLTQHVLILYDNDVGVQDENLGNLFIRSLPTNHNNEAIKNGIENLLPEAVIEEQFYTTSEAVQGNGTRVTTRVLDKTRLCAAVCNNRRNPDDFFLFGSLLEEIRQLLLD